MRYVIDGHWYTPDQLSDMTGIPAHTIRDRLRRGYPITEAIKDNPIHESVSEFCYSSCHDDWIGMSINNLHKIYWKWCVSNEYTPIQIQGFSRQIMKLYPLKVVPTRQGDKYNRIIRRRD